MAGSPDVPADHEAVCGPPTASEGHARRLLDEALEVWRHRFPDVPVTTRLYAADLADALVRESEGAALTVVGSQARGTVWTALLGSVGRRVVQRARSPVVVVRFVRTGESAGVGHGTGQVADPAGPRPVRRRRAPWG